MSYNDLLRESAKKAGNVVCMGLDPVLDTLPNESMNKTERITTFFDMLFSAMKKRGLSVAAFKPNLGFYQALDMPREKDFSGSIALSNVMDLIRSNFPETPIILDSKRGDIAKSSFNYAKEAFSSWQSDAVTVSPYMGSDSVLPFAFENKGVYVLNRTSNPGGAELQNRLAIDPIDEHTVYPLYIAVSHMISAWSDEHEGIGAVVGATNMTEFEDIAKYYADKDIPMLIPGVGSQGGSASDVLSVMRKCSYDVFLSRINSSSQLTHPWKKGPAPENWLDMCLDNIEKLTLEALIK